jgi:hypothetical protein
MSSSGVGSLEKRSDAFEEQKDYPLNADFNGSMNDLREDGDVANCEG